MTLMSSGAARSVPLAVLVALLAAGCSSDPTSGPVPPTTTTPAAPSGVARWQQDYDYLAAQTRSVQIVCGYVRSDHGHLVPTPRRGWFLSFSDAPSVRSLFITPFDPSGAQPKRSRPDGPFRKCSANVPPAVPFQRAAINRFLAKHGLIYGVDSAHAHGLTPVDVLYAGRGRFRRYRDQPGLFALGLALVPQSLGGGPAMSGSTAPKVYATGTNEIIPPRTERQAAVYQWFTDLVVHWYRYGHGY